MSRQLRRFRPLLRLRSPGTACVHGGGKGRAFGRGWRIPYAADEAGRGGDGGGIRHCAASVTSPTGVVERDRATTRKPGADSRPVAEADHRVRALGRDDARAAGGRVRSLLRDWTGARVSGAAQTRTTE